LTVHRTARRLIAIWASAENSRASREQPLQRLKEIGLAEGMTLLDIGCGIGFYSFYASTIVREKGLIHALDRNQQFIAYLTKKAKRQNIGNIHAVFADAHETGLPSESVDVVFINQVLHCLEDKPRAVKEFNRVLKKNGKLAVDEKDLIPLSTVRELAEQAGFKFTKSLRETVQVFEKVEMQVPERTLDKGDQRRWI